MRAAATLRLMEEEGVDLFKFFRLRPNEPLDYEQLGLPVQGVAIKLKGKDVIRKKGIKVYHPKKEDGERGNQTRRTLWIQGCYYNRLLDHFIKIMIEEQIANVLPMQHDQEIAIIAA